MHWYPTTGAPQLKATTNVATAVGIHIQQTPGGKIASLEDKNDHGREKEINHQPPSRPKEETNVEELSEQV